MSELTREQAVKIFDSGIWKDMTDEQKVKFQLFEERLCMPWSEFQMAVERVLGRPVWTHEFANWDALKKEYLGEKAAPTFEEIMNQIPAEKRLLIGL